MTVTLLGFSTEPGFDFLYVFAGATTRSPLIGQLTGAFLDLVTRAFSSQEGLVPYCSRIMTMPLCTLSAVCVCVSVHGCGLPSQHTLPVHRPSRFCALCAALTLRFTSDDGAVSAGFVATVRPDPPTLVVVPL